MRPYEMGLKSEHQVYSIFLTLKSAESDLLSKDFKCANEIIQLRVVHGEGNADGCEVAVRVAYVQSTVTIVKHFSVVSVLQPEMRISFPSNVSHLPCCQIRSSHPGVAVIGAAIEVILRW